MYKPQTSKEEIRARSKQGRKGQQGGKELQLLLLLGPGPGHVRTARKGRAGAVEAEAGQAARAPAEGGGAVLAVLVQGCGSARVRVHWLRGCYDCCGCGLLSKALLVVLAVRIPPEPCWGIGGSCSAG